MRLNATVDMHTHLQEAAHKRAEESSTLHEAAQLPEELHSVCLLDDELAVLLLKELVIQERPTWWSTSRSRAAPGRGPYGQGSFQKYDLIVAKDLLTQ